ncbi:MAG TPA: hypothetical protein VI381_05165 [Allosphingosinicella sp.]
MRGLLALLLAAIPALAGAQAISTSPAPDAVAVTVYRDPYRSPGVQMSKTWLNGFALVTETRRVTIPAGEGDIRFEGVAGGIIPESAIVTGLPDGVAEKNQDALLLSPASLIDRSLGKRVHIRRTTKATGEVQETDAVIRSSADGAVVLETQAGVEALRCTGLPETIVYDEAPAGLSAKPTLSVRTRSVAESSATVTLSYLASGFDWQANYVATLSPSGDRMDLFAWLTLASGDETSFPDAQTSAVAGKLERRSYAPPKPQGRLLTLQCWPSGTTSDIDDHMPPPPPPPPAPPPPPVAAAPMEMVVSAARAPVAMQAQQEELGDLKLYRIPEPVTVAAQSQKQVALLDKPGIPVRRVYKQIVYAQMPEQALPIQAVLVTRNKKEDGLGVPLPAGKVRFFAESDGRPMLAGQGSLADKAVGEDIEIELDDSPTGVRMIALHVPGTDPRYDDYELTVTNDGKWGVSYEAVLVPGDLQIIPVSTRLSRKGGEQVWAVNVPGNGSAKFRYRVKRRP